MSAALSAKEAGADVVVIEKQATTGGTTAIAGGYLISIDSKLYDDSDFDDSLETFRKYWDEPVSYTQLEVYKRQRPCLRRRKSKNCSSSCGI